MQININTNEIKPVIIAVYRKSGYPKMDPYAEVNINKYVEAVIRAACSDRVNNLEILISSAEMTYNERLSNDHSSNVDVWIEAAAYFNFGELIMIKAYLSDMQQISTNTERNMELLSHMFIRKFVLAE